MRYFKWDYEKMEMIEYDRQGECNGCGACCKALIKFKTSQPSHPNDDPRNGGTGTDETGVWAELMFDNEARRLWKFDPVEKDMPDPCPQLSADHRCGIHNHFSNLCSQWPIIPDNVTPFSECSFKFVEINRVPIDEPEPIKASLVDDEVGFDSDLRVGNVEDVSVS